MLEVSRTLILSDSEDLLLWLLASLVLNALLALHSINLSSCSLLQRNVLIEFPMLVYGSCGECQL